MRNRILFFCSICILQLGLSASAQYDPSKINKKAIEAYDKGIEKAEAGKYADAIESFKEAIQRDANYVEAYLSMAGVYGQMKNYGASISYYEKAFAVDSNYTSDFRLPYSINLAGMGQFDKALATITALLSKSNLGSNTRKAAEYRQKTFQFAVDYEKNNPRYAFGGKRLCSICTG